MRTICLILMGQPLRTTESEAKCIYTQSCYRTIDLPQECTSITKCAGGGPIILLIAFLFAYYVNRKRPPATDNFVRSVILKQHIRKNFIPWSNLVEFSIFKRKCNFWEFLAFSPMFDQLSFRFLWYYKFVITYNHMIQKQVKYDLKASKYDLFNGNT